MASATIEKAGSNDAYKDLCYHLRYHIEDNLAALMLLMIIIEKVTAGLIWHPGTLQSRKRPHRE